MNTSFQAEIKHQLTDDNLLSNSSLERLQSTARKRQASQDSNSSGLGKSPEVSNSSHNSSFESKSTENATKIQEKGTTTYLLVGKKRSLENIKAPARIELTSKDTAPKCSLKTWNDSNLSRRKFEEARTQVMQKLKLRVPEGYSNGIVAAQMYGFNCDRRPRNGSLV